MLERRQLSIAALIAVVTVAFAAEALLGGARASAEQFGAVPKSITTAWATIVRAEPDAGALRSLAALATALLVHGDFEHLLYNMIFLWAFGSLVARHLGAATALATFLITGVAGNLVQVALNAESPIPIIGASGAVCGFEGVYLGLALRWNLPDPDVWPLAHPVPPLQLAAFAVVGFLFDAYSLMNHNQGIAYGAHIGGFISGVALAAILTTIFPTARAWTRR